VWFDRRLCFRNPMDQGGLLLDTEQDPTPQELSLNECSV
jgi:hypothetical protein